MMTHMKDLSFSISFALTTITHIFTIKSIQSFNQLIAIDRQLLAYPPQNSLLSPFQALPSFPLKQRSALSSIFPKKRGLSFKSADSRAQDDKYIKCLLNIIIFMSNPNHIIIPIVKTKPTPEELNVFQSAALCLTPQKEAPLSKLLVDKKYSSAFKRYKQKKDRKDQNGEESHKHETTIIIKKQKKPFKLKIRHMEEPTINKNIQQLYNFTVKFGFYDPNEAPLYASDSNPNPELTKTQSNSLEKTERMQEEIQVQLQQKLKNEHIEQEMEVKYVEVNYRDDDPFIIIKKTNTKKPAVTKTKPVEKRKKKIPHKTILYTVTRDQNGTPTIQRIDNFNPQRFKFMQQKKEEYQPSTTTENPKDAPQTQPPSIVKTQYVQAPKEGESGMAMPQTDLIS